MKCFLVLRKPLLVRLRVVMSVLFCGLFLGVAEITVSSPVCCYRSTSFHFFVLLHVMIIQSVLLEGN